MALGRSTDLWEHWHVNIYKLTVKRWDAASARTGAFRAVWRANARHTRPRDRPESPRPPDKPPEAPDISRTPLGPVVFIYFRYVSQSFRGHVHGVPRLGRFTGSCVVGSEFLH